MSDDRIREPEPPSGPNVVSLAAHWYANARDRAARAGAPPELTAALAELGDLTARLETLTAQPAPTPQPDGSDIPLRYDRAAEQAELSVRIADIMTTVTDDDPDASALWQVIARSNRESAAHMRQAAETIRNAGIT